MKYMTKKGQVGNLQGFILAIVSVAIVLAVGLIVLDELSGTATTGSAAANATDDIIDELAGVPTWIGIIIVVALAMVVLAYFFSKR